MVTSLLSTLNFLSQQVRVTFVIYQKKMHFLSAQIIAKKE